MRKGRGREREREREKAPYRLPSNHFEIEASYCAESLKAAAASSFRSSYEVAPSDSFISFSTFKYCSGEVTIVTARWFLAADRSIEGPPGWSGERDVREREREGAREGRRGERERMQK